MLNLKTKFSKGAFFATAIFALICAGAINNTVVAGTANSAKNKCTCANAINNRSNKNAKNFTGPKPMAMSTSHTSHGGTHDPNPEGDHRV